MTRTTGQGAAAPSRDGRGATPSASRGKRAARAQHRARHDHLQYDGARHDPLAAAPFKPAAPAALRSSNSRRSAGPAIRGSRQARCSVSTLAAGIDAASMARRCRQPLKKSCAVFVPRPRATSEGRWGTLSGEVKEGICPKGKGGTGAGKSPLPSPAQTKPARSPTPTPTPTPTPAATATATNSQRNVTPTRTSACPQPPAQAPQLPAPPRSPPAAWHAHGGCPA